MSGDFSDLLLPFGQLPSGRLVSPAEVERGAACGCICPQCAAALWAKKGDQIRHHFAHTAAEGCGGGALETALHKMAKQIIADAGKVWLPDLKVWYPIHKHDPMRTFRDVQRGVWLVGSVSVEERFSGFQPDAVIRSAAMKVAIEVFVSHAVDAEKRDKIKAAELATIEIDLSQFSRNLTTDALVDYVLHKASRLWVFHPGEAAARRECEERYLRRWRSQVEKEQAEEARKVSEKQEAVPPDARRLLFTLRID